MGAGRRDLGAVGPALNFQGSARAPQSYGIWFSCSWAREAEEKAPGAPEMVFRARSPAGWQHGGGGVEGTLSAQARQRRRIPVATRAAEGLGLSAGSQS